MSKMKPGGGAVIGWREWVALPDLGIRAIKAKIDTGARSSALHAYDVELFTEGGRRMVRFRVHPLQRDARTSVAAAAPLLEERHVRNSGGGVELRPVIETPVKLLGKLWTIELTLTNRDAMGFRMLLGRQAVRGRFLVDPSTSYMGGRGPKRKAKKSAPRKKKAKTPSGTKRAASRGPDRGKGKVEEKDDSSETTRERKPDR